MTASTPQIKKIESPGSVYCPMCTHTVEANLTHGAKGLYVSPGQKCPRCSSALDAGYVFRFDRAA